MSQSIKLSITSNGTKYKFHIVDVIPDNNIVHLSVKFPTSSPENKTIEADETKLNNSGVDENDTQHGNNTHDDTQHNGNNTQQHNTDGQITFLRGNANTQSIHVTELKNHNIPRLQHQQDTIGSDVDRPDNRIDATVQDDDRHTNRTIDHTANRNVNRNMTRNVNRRRRRRTANHPVNQTANHSIDQTVNRNTGRNRRRRRRTTNHPVTHPVNQTANRNTTEINEQPVIYINASDIAHNDNTHVNDNTDASQTENQAISAEDLFLQSFNQGLTSIFNSLIGSNNRRTQQSPVVEPPAWRTFGPFGSFDMPNSYNPYNSLNLPNTSYNNATGHRNTLPNNRTVPNNTILPNNTNTTATYHEMLRNLDEQYNRERRDQQQTERQNGRDLDEQYNRERRDQQQTERQSNRQRYQNQYNNIHSGDLDMIVVPIIDSNLLDPLRTRLVSDTSLHLTNASTTPNNTNTSTTDNTSTTTNNTPNNTNTSTTTNNTNTPVASTTVHSSSTLATIHANIIRNAGDKNRPKIPIEIVASMPQYRALEEKNNVLFDYFKSTMTAVDELLLLAMNSTNAGIAHIGKILDVEFENTYLKCLLK